MNNKNLRYEHCVFPQRDCDLVLYGKLEHENGRDEITVLVNVLLLRRDTMKKTHCRRKHLIGSLLTFLECLSMIIMVRNRQVWLWSSS